MAILVAYKAKDQSGQYFRIYDKPWRQLADLIIDHCPDLLRCGEIEGWYLCEGHIVMEEAAAGIADRIEALLKVRSFPSGVTNIYYLTQSDVVGFIEFIRNCEGFDICK